MPVYVKDPADHTWKQANNPTSKLVFIRVNQTWYPAAYVSAMYGGIWRDPGYVGNPNAPTALTVTSTATNFTNFSFSWTAPVGGAPVDHYRFIFYHQDGSFWVDTTVPAGTTVLTNWPVGTDTYYQMEVKAVSAAGVESAPSNRVRYFVGHPQQTRSDPVYGWGAYYDLTPTFVYASTTAVISGTTYSGTRAVDGNLGTYWASGSRSSSTFMEALRISGPSSYRRVYSVRCWPGVQCRMWLGMSQDGTFYGPQTAPNNASLWFDANARAYFQHIYLMATPEWPANNEFEMRVDDVNPGYVFTLDRCTIDIAVDLLKPLLSGTRGALTELILRVQDWTIVSYNTVVTVNQVNNAYW